MAHVIALSVMVAVVLAYTLRANGVDPVVGVPGIVVVLCAVQALAWWMAR